MIPRYSKNKIANIWSEENKFKIWLEIECLACEAMAKFNFIPKSAAVNIRKKSKFNIKRINELEKQLKHDVISFLANVSENIGEDSKFLHQGLTSSDIVDTAFSIQLTQASDIIISDLTKILKTLKKKAYSYKFTPIIGRSHGIHAETTTFGLKLAGFYAEFERNLKRMKNAKKEISTCAISGPVGNYSSIDPKIEQYIAKKLNLSVETVSTQVIPRDRHAAFFATIAIIASSVERLATEIRNLQRTEISEVQEFFSINQKGSSAMPHKKNPINSENISGLSRYIRGLISPALENVSLWHERDISHSSVERIIGPDSTIALNFSLIRLEEIMNNIIVYPKNMKKNIDLTMGLNFSQKLLLTLIKKGISREKSYKIVQKAAKESWNKKIPFKKTLTKSIELKKLINVKEINMILNNKDYRKHVNLIFKRTFSNKS